MAAVYENQDHQTKNQPKWTLILGILGALGGALLYLINVVSWLEVAPGFTEGQLVALLGEVLDIGYRLGLGLGFLGLAAYYDDKLCLTVGVAELILLADQWLFGLVGLLSELISPWFGAGLSILLHLASVAAIALLFRRSSSKLLFLGSGAFLLIVYAVSWALRHELFSYVSAFLYASAVAVIMGVAFLNYRKTVAAAPAYIPPAGGGYPPPPQGGY